MKVHVLGSSGTYPVLGRPASGYVVEENGTRILCDAGPGTFQVLLRSFDPAALTAVVISHRHGDHCSDLLALYHHLAYGTTSVAPIPLLAPTDTLEALSAFAASADGWRRAFDLRPAVGSMSLGGLGVSFVEACHSVPAVVTRFESAHRSLVYTGDTGSGGDWRGFVAGADVLLSEASYQGTDPPWPLHLTATEAGRIAREQEVSRLVLTHIPPHLDPTRSVEEAETAFDRPVGLAVTGTTIDL